jgi:hypothetical protein
VLSCWICASENRATAEFDCEVPEVEPTEVEFDELDPVFGLVPATEGGFEFPLNRGDLLPLFGEEGLEFDRLLINKVRT